MQIQPNNMIDHLQMCIFTGKRFGIKDGVGCLSNHSEALSALVKYSIQKIFELTLQKTKTTKMVRIQFQVNNLCEN